MQKSQFHIFRFCPTFYMIHRNSCPKCCILFWVWLELSLVWLDYRRKDDWLGHMCEGYFCMECLKHINPLHKEATWCKFNYRYQSHVRYNILIKFPKFKKNKIALAIKKCHELFQLILGYTMCKVCVVSFRGCLIRDTTSPSWNKPQSQELVTLFKISRRVSVKYKSKYSLTFFLY